MADCGTEGHPSLHSTPHAFVIPNLLSSSNLRTRNQCNIELCRLVTGTFLSTTVYKNIIILAEKLVLPAFDPLQNLSFTGIILFWVGIYDRYMYRCINISILTVLQALTTCIRACGLACIQSKFPFRYYAGCVI